MHTHTSNGFSVTRQFSRKTICNKKEEITVTCKNNKNKNKE